MPDASAALYSAKCSPIPENPASAAAATRVSKS